MTTVHDHHDVMHVKWRINLYDYIYNAEFRIPDSLLRRYLKHRKEKGINYLALHNQVAGNYYKQGDFLTLRFVIALSIFSTDRCNDATDYTCDSF
jgi:hypothetical protein